MNKKKNFLKKAGCLFLMIVTLAFAFPAAPASADTIVTTGGTTYPYFHTTTNPIAAIFYFVGDVIALPFRFIGDLID